MIRLAYKDEIWLVERRHEFNTYEDVKEWVSKKSRYKNTSYIKMLNIKHLWLLMYNNKRNFQYIEFINIISLNFKLLEKCLKYIRFSLYAENCKYVRVPFLFEYVIQYQLCKATMGILCKICIIEAYFLLNYFESHLIYK